jgi:subfamily B ATP-binding cassette protein MsbA
MKIFLRSLKYAAPYKGPVLIVLVSSAVSAAVNLAYVFLIKKGVNSAADGNMGTVRDIMAVTVLLLVINGLFSFGRSILSADISERITSDVRNELFAHILHMPIPFFKEESEGSLISRLNSDAANVKTLVNIIISGALFQPLKILLLAGVAFYLDAKLAIVLYAFIPLAFLTARLTGKKIREISSDLNVLRGSISSFLEQRLYGIELIKLSVSEEKEKNAYSSLNGEYLRGILRTAKLTNLSIPLNKIIMAGCFGVIILFGTIRVSSGDLSPGSFAAFGAIGFSVYEFLGSMNRVYNTGQIALSSSHRIFEILDRPVEDFASGRDFRGLSHEILIKDLSFSYSPGEPVLRNINMVLRAGENILLKGASGSGKTTLMKLLIGFYGTETGQIMIDGIPSGEYSAASLRRLINYVPQETILLNGKISENICYGVETPSFERMRMAASVACIRSFIEKNPKGYDTFIGDRGTGLSQGQKQRIALARAFMRGGDVLILDEATSSIDTDTEKKIIDNIKASGIFGSMIIISHRPGIETHTERGYILTDGISKEI